MFKLGHINKPEFLLSLADTNEISYLDIGEQS